MGVRMPQCDARLKCSRHEVSNTNVCGSVGMEPIACFASNTLLSWRRSCCLPKNHVTMIPEAALAEREVEAHE